MALRSVDFENLKELYYTKLAFGLLSDFCSYLWVYPNFRTVFLKLDEADEATDDLFPDLEECFLNLSALKYFTFIADYNEKFIANRPSFEIVQIRNSFVLVYQRFGKIERGSNEWNFETIFTLFGKAIQHLTLRMYDKAEFWYQSFTLLTTSASFVHVTELFLNNPTTIAATPTKGF